jgi:transposase
MILGPSLILDGGLPNRSDRRLRPARTPLGHTIDPRPGQCPAALTAQTPIVSRMTGKTRAVIGGVDTHTDTHEAAVLHKRGRLLAVEGFPTSPSGYQQLLGWIHSFGAVREIGVESSGAYGTALTRHLRTAGVKVVEVNRPHAHTRNRRGKNDAIDAEAAARKVLAGECTAVPKDTTGIIEAIRQLLLARASAVHARAAALHQLGELVITAPAEVRQSLTAKTLPGKASQATRWRPDPARLADPAQAARMALRSIVRRIHTLGDEIKLLDAQLSTLVRRAAPKTLALLGVGIVHTAQMLIPQARTSKGGTARTRSRTCTAPTRSRHRPARPNGTVSTPAATATPAAPSTSSPWSGCATANAPAPTPSAAPATESPRKRSSAASRDTSPARSTTPSA